MKNILYIHSMFIYSFRHREEVPNGAEGRTKEEAVYATAGR